jgi:hypothetical protein
MAMIERKIYKWITSKGKNLIICDEIDANKNNSEIPLYPLE